MANINPDDPFKFGIPLGETSWVNVHDVGGSSTGADVQLGNGNRADANDATVITTHASHTPALAGQNSETGDGAVGVFGRSTGATRSIGVAGESQTGCGVYGISTNGNTIGVAGRSMGGQEVEDDPLEVVVREPVGVLGHSTNGPGIRGHGGPLFTLQGGPPPTPVQAAPGGSFSSGQLQDVPFFFFGGTETVSLRASLDSLAQLRLIPSANAKLPATGQIGDLYVRIFLPPGGGPIVTMHLCVQPSDGGGLSAMWAPFSLGAPQQGG
jgi:hypothetical protein